MQIAEIVGVLAASLLSFSAIPQVFKSFRERNCRGFSWWYLLILECGFLLMITHVMLTAPLFWVILNYIVNSTSVGTLIFIKAKSELGK